jgi:molecular chaperone GrpE
VKETTVQSVVRTGYRVGDDVIRHAQVGVVDPAGEPAETTDDEVETDPETE